MTPDDPFDTASLRATVLAAWAASPTRLAEDAAAEDDLARIGYRDRVVTELAANAADAATITGSPGRLDIRLRDDGTVSVANTGEPLTACYAPHHERFPDNSIDMGTGYDCFDELAHTDDPRVEEPARRNRQLLKSVLESVGMENYPYEWWHFTLVDEPFPDTYFDFPVSRGSLRG